MRQALNYEVSHRGLLPKYMNNELWTPISEMQAMKDSHTIR